MKKLALLFIAAATLVSCGGGGTGLSGKLFMASRDQPSGLFELDLGNPSADRKIADIVDAATLTGLDMFDTAWNGSELYGIHNANKLYRINTTTGRGTFIGTLPNSINSLAFDGTGQLWGANNTLYKISKATASMQQVGNGIAFSSSGDIVFSSNDTLYMSASNGGVDNWVQINTTTGLGTLIGSMNASAVYGMARVENTLIGGTADGKLLTINPSTGTATELRTLTVTNTIGGLKTPVQLR
jgi:hypothetical protein